MIYPPAALLLEQFSKEHFFKKKQAQLIGGTAIAFHVKHRMSFDIDITFPHHSTLPSLDVLEKYNAKPLPFDRAVIDSVINDGGEIEDYHKRFSIDGVKVDFVVNPSSNILESEILKNDISVPFGYLQITSLDTLFKLKSLLLLDRNKIRDLYDIVYMLEYEGYNAKDILETIKEYRFTYTDNHIVQNIQAKKPDELDVETEGIMEPKMDILEYDILQKYIIDKLLKVK